MNDSKNMHQRILSFNSVVKLIEEKKLKEKYNAFIPIVQSIEKRLAKIKQLPWQLKPDKNSETKKIFRHNLANAAHVVSCGVYSYAQVSGNAALKNAVHYSCSDFYRPIESTMLGRCRQVLNAVKKVKSPEQFGLTPAVIENLVSELKIYTDFMHTPVSKIKERARATKRAQKLIDECLFIVQNQLEPLMIIVHANENLIHKNGNPDGSLLNQYAIARKCHKPMGRNRKYIKKQKPQQPETIIAAPQISVEKELASAIQM
jgi:hypothetical protein